jgi:hypothetical protein
VRVNSIQSGLCEEDLTVVLSGEGMPDALVVPKAGGLQPRCCPAAARLPDCQAALLPACPPLLRLLLLLLVRGSASQLPCPPAPSCSLNPAFPAPLYLPSHYLPLLQVDTVDHIRWLFNSVKTLARRPQSAVQQGAPPPALITMCESGMGLLNLRCGTAVHAALLCGNSGGESKCCPCLPCRRTHRKRRIHLHMCCLQGHL